MADSGDKLARACARLKSLKENLPPQEKHIAESYATEFHSALDSLEQLGIDVGEFRLPPTRLLHISWRPFQGEAPPTAQSAMWSGASC